MKLRLVASAAIIFLLTLTGCQQMDPTQFGVKFRKLPPLLGGGVGNSVIRPGETIIVMPWESIYRFDTKPKDVSWGSKSEHSEDTYQSDFVDSRARDGNEVALAFTVRYRVSPEAEKLTRLVQTAATNDEEVRELVIALGRSDIRQYMNELHTSEFFNTTSRYAAVDKVKASMIRRLEPYGIDIVQVNLDDYRFERKLKDGSTDASYQARLTEIQQLTEDTERERSRTETVKAEKERERRGVEAQKNQLEAEAEGYKNQRRLIADAYYEARMNEAKAILAKGKAEVEGMIEKINAMNGPGGEALLKLEIAKQLLKGDAKFVVLNQKGGASMDLQKIDTNELLRQIGVADAVQSRPAKPAAIAQPTSKEADEGR